ncbi:MAG: hypothetical protein Q8O99_03790 [bacterium]|nr:hypothetical protein [bacterium]
MERCYPQDFETFGTEAPEPTLIAVFLWHMAEKIRNTPKQSTASLIKQVLKDKGEEYTAITGRSSKMIRSYITAWVASNNVDSLRQQQGVDHLDQMALSYYIEERNKGVVQNIGKLPVGTLVMVPF